MTTAADPIRAGDVDKGAARIGREVSKAYTKIKPELRSAGARCSVPNSYTEMKQKSGLRLLQATISAQVMRVSGCESGTMQVTKPKIEKPATPKPQVHGYRYK